MFSSFSISLKTIILNEKYLKEKENNNNKKD